MISHIAVASVTLLGPLPLPQDPPTPVSVEDANSMDPEISALIASVLALAQEDPASGAAHAELGLVYEANTLYRAAVRSYTNALALLDDSPEWIYRRAVVLEASGDPIAALADMRRAANALKNTPVIQVRLGTMLLAQGDVQGAEGAFMQAIAAEAKQPQPVAWPQSRVGLCQVRIAQESWIEPSEMLERIVAENPDYRHAHYLLGLCYLELGRDADAKAHLQAGVNAWPEYPPDPHQPRLDGYSAGYHRRMMGIENMLMGGQIEPAIRSLTEMLAADSNNHAVLHLLGRAHLMAGEVDLGIETLRKAESAHPHSVDIKIELGTALMNRMAMSIANTDVETRQSIVNEVMSKAREAVSTAPNLGRAHYFLGLVYSFTLDPSAPDPQTANAALQSMSTALQLGCSEPQLLERLAGLYAQTGRQGEMLRFAVANAERNMGNAGAFLFLARAQFTVGNATQAVGAAKRAFDLAPREPQVAMFYVQSLVSTQNMDEAVRLANWMSQVMAANADVIRFCQNVREVARTGSLPGQLPPKQDGGDQESPKDSAPDTSRSSR
jgi:tetratricopeptide (TPR) repeat protein